MKCTSVTTNGKPENARRAGKHSRKQLLPNSVSKAQGSASSPLSLLDSICSSDYAPGLDDAAPKDSTFSYLRAPAGTKWLAPKTVLLGAGGRGRKIRRTYAQNFEGKSAAFRRVTNRLEKQITLQDGESNSPRIGASPSHSEVRDDHDRRSVVDRQAQNEHTPQELTERARDEQALHASTAGARKKSKGKYAILLAN